MADDPTQPPGTLTPVQKLWEGIKHVGSKALKWAAIGALVGGLAMGVVPGVLAMATSWIPWVGGAIAGGAASSFMSGAIALGTVTGLVGAVKGLSDVSEVVDEAEERSIANMQRVQTRAAQMAALQDNMAQKHLALAQQAQMLGGQQLPPMGGPAAGRSVG